MKENEQTRSHILDSAIHSFADSGYQATSMSKIAKKAGVSKSLIFWYFESKSKLFESLVDRFVAQCAISFVRLDAKTKSLEKMHEIIDMYWAFVKNNMEFIRIFMNWFLQAETKEKRKTERLRKIHRSFEEIFVQCLQLGIEEGIFDENLNIQNTALSIVSSLEGLLVQVIMLGQSPEDFDETFFKNLKQSIVHGIMKR
ncbi:TetR/AcrR family transcriptional regulator [Candidatus Uabimicrobium amorphum]|uniref:TetR family transcriptional regulator n=1 Tax=Uabimicrobium amorphum TaxID=2596890 RepID=A0A5S9IMZ3_UABAM|nr:TetR/AcrR family transcriptional regulator [Candidatus Uabimicrobium amorphum]BBM83535.1 TetR family transcriptional regulator [Candidatus Uabimicrobium amorphum]